MHKYLVVTQRTAQFQEAIIGKHIEYLDELRAQGKLEMSGPFTDMSGGAYILKVESLDAAKAIAAADPIQTTGSSKGTVYEWRAR